MRKMCIRIIIYIIGLITLALGIVLNTKTLLGVSPIISVPYCISQIGQWNLGMVTFFFYCVCVAVEAFFKGREFHFYELLQIPMSLVTSIFINIFNDFLVIQPENTLEKVVVLIAGILVTGVGVATMVNMKLVPNPADALAAVIGEKLGKDMGLGKNVFDFTSFCISCIIGIVITHQIIGIGAGTIVVVIFTGRVIAVYNKFCKEKMQKVAGLA